MWSAALAAMALMLSAGSIRSAFAHESFTFPVTSSHLQNKEAVLVIGHSAEPAFGVERGVTNGLHNLELSLTDFDTKMPLAGAQLKADKYYFKDIESFNAATPLNYADANQTGVTVGGIFGQPGFYQARQLVSEGIYGYRIYGTIDYFGEASVPIDVTTFCRSTEGNTTKFNSLGFPGGYGCVSDVETFAFPSNALQNNGDDNGAKSTAVVKVVAVGPNGEDLRMFTKLRNENKELVTQGYTPFFFQGNAGNSYQVSIANFGSRVFDRWDDGSTSKDRTITLSEDTTLKASYRAKSETTTSNSTSSPAALTKQDEAQVTIPVTYNYAGAQDAAVTGIAGFGATSSSSESASLLQLFAVAIPVAVAGAIGARVYRRKKEDNGPE